MAKSESNHITSCTISWENREDILSVVTSGRIWPMSEQQKQELYGILYNCIEDWDCDNYTVNETDSNCWQFKICTQRSCLRTVYGTIKPPPHGVEIKKILTEIIGEDNCYFF